MSHNDKIFFLIQGLISCVIGDNYTHIYIAGIDIIREWIPRLFRQNHTTMIICNNIDSVNFDLKDQGQQ